MKVVNSNSIDKTCDNPISSNCVTWGGNQVAGICAGASITQVVERAITLSSGITCPCYTGNWVDFTTDIPLSGLGVGYTFTITNFGANGVNRPGYKWTKEGDLSIRGGFDIIINVTSPKLYIIIPLTLIPPACFPIGFTANQIITTGVDAFPNQSGVNIVNISDVSITYPTGQLSLEYQYSDATLAPMTMNIDFGGTRFNLV